MDFVHPRFNSILRHSSYKGSHGMGVLALNALVPPPRKKGSNNSSDRFPLKPRENNPNTFLGNLKHAKSSSGAQTVEQLAVYHGKGPRPDSLKIGSRKHGQSCDLSQGVVGSLQYLGIHRTLRINQRLAWFAVEPWSRSGSLVGELHAPDLRLPADWSEVQTCCLPLKLSSPKQICP